MRLSIIYTKLISQNVGKESVSHSNDDIDEAVYHWYSLSRQRLNGQEEALKIWLKHLVIGHLGLLMGGWRDSRVDVI